ncbi:MAG: low molecular weight phosphotyrosine protein phosphatase [Eubacteriaceae bacterium]|nr:low molecular weight phosphotyrosine protein phosphatase [Eubacteriaceae bacterium]
MISVMFVCHGNICRSPMAEFVMKDIVRKNGMEGMFVIDSCATSREEIGNDMYPPAKRMLTEKGVRFGKRKARQITEEDLAKYDHLICMDRNNMRNLTRMFGNKADKVRLMMNIVGEERDVADPWYTGDFEATYDDVLRGCSALFEEIVGKK